MVSSWEKSQSCNNVVTTASQADWEERDLNTNLKIKQHKLFLLTPAAQRVRQTQCIHKTTKKMLPATEVVLQEQVAVLREKTS